MVLAAVALALRLRPRVARVAWLFLLAAGMTNALILNLHAVNLIHPNLVHYFLGAKYPVPYPKFYEAVSAAMEKPQVGMRDLRNPSRFLYATPAGERAYYIDLMRGAGVEFDPLVPVQILRNQAISTGALRQQSRQTLDEQLGSKAGDFRRDVRYAYSRSSGRDITRDAGFNGSPFYTLVRRADPTLYQPLGPSTAWFNLAWQTLSVLLIAWVMGKTLRLDIDGRIAMAALVFASWDFVGYAFPGLVFAGLWLPLALALSAIGRRALAPAGVAIAWAGLIKLFPFFLMLPAGMRVLRGAWMRVRKRESAVDPGPWLKMIIACVLAAAVLGLLSLLGGRSWGEYLDKIFAQFGPTGIAGNNVSVSRALHTLGISNSPLPLVFSAVSLVVLAAMFAREREKQVLAALPRRTLVLLAAIGWVSRQWLNYYSIAVLLLLPLLARRHRVGAPLAAAAMALSFVLPEFNDPLLHDYPVLAILKVAPYVVVPAWLVVLEFRSIGLTRATRRIAAVVAAALVLLTAAEAWRMHTIRRLEQAGYEYFNSDRPQQALRSYERLLRLSPRNDAAFMRRAVVKTVLGDVSGAEEDYLSAIRFNPENTDARRNYGQVLLQAGFVDAAAQQLEDASHFRPDDPGVLHDLARIRLRQGRASDAAALLMRARELDPVDPRIREQLERLAPSPGEDDR